MKYHLIYNPLSGNGKSREQVSEIESVFEDKVIWDITRITDYSEFFSNISDDDKIVICGGDGTLNRFVNATKNLNIKNNIYFYSVGTGNDFSRDLGKEKAAEPDFCIDEYIRNLPVVTVNGTEQLFINGVGFGIDGYCCEVGDELKKKSDKPVNYTGIAIKGLLFFFKPVTATVTVDGEKFTYKKVWIAPTMNGRFYGGGMMCAPDQNRLNEDGKLSLVLMYGAGRLRTLCVFPSIFKGEHIKQKKMVAVHTGHDITVEFDRPTALQIDGETYLNVTKYRARSGGKRLMMFA